MRKEATQEEQLVLALVVFTTYRIGYWLGRKAEQRDLLRTIRALRITLASK
jgi:hypothetical protein